MEWMQICQNDGKQKWVLTQAGMLLYRCRKAFLDRGMGTEANNLSSESTEVFSSSAA